MTSMTPTLNGLRILNTRPLEQGRALSQAIIEAGGVSIHVPALVIEPTPIDWFTTLPTLSDIQQAIFISPNAVDYFFSALQTHHLAWPTTLQVVAVGHATASNLAHWGVRVHHIPPIADSEHVLMLESLTNVHSQRILLVKGDGGRELIMQTLCARGAEVIPVAVYRRALPIINKEYIDSLWQNDAVDTILFTSEQAMHNVFALFGDKAKAWLCSKPCLVISPRLATAASSFGIRSITCTRHDDLIHTLQGLAHA